MWPMVTMEEKEIVAAWITSLLVESGVKVLLVRVDQLRRRPKMAPVHLVRNVGAASPVHLNLLLLPDPMTNKPPPTLSPRTMEAEDNIAPPIVPHGDREAIDPPRPPRHPCEIKPEYLLDLKKRGGSEGGRPCFVCCGGWKNVQHQLVCIPL